MTLCLTWKTGVAVGVGALAVGAVALTPTDARACSPDPCAGIDSESPFRLLGTEVASDGVIAVGLVAAYDGPSGESLTAELTLDGTPVAGEFVEDLDRGVLLFEPTEPLTPGTYEIHLQAEQSFCFGATEETLTTTVVAATLPTPSGPSPTATATYSTQPVQRLDALVCCDDASPSVDSCGGIHVGADGFCAATREVGRLTVDLDAITELPEIERSNVVVQISFNGSTWTLPAGMTTWSVTRDEPLCLTPSLVHLASGEVVDGEELCFDAEPGQTLGELEVDPWPELDAECVGAPFTCQSDDWNWSSEVCEDYPRDDGGSDDGGSDDGGSDGGGSDGSGGSAGADDSAADRGCACSAQRRSPTAAWAWLGLFALAWHRRQVRPSSLR